MGSDFHSVKAASRAITPLRTILVDQSEAFVHVSIRMHKRAARYDQSPQVLHTSIQMKGDFAVSLNMIP